MEVVLDPDERTEEAMVQRIVALGFEIRVEFMLGDGTEVWAQLTRAELQQLELREGQIVYLRPGQTKSFNGISRRPIARGASTPRGAPDGGDAESLCSRLKGDGAGRALPGGAPPHLATPIRTDPRGSDLATAFDAISLLLLFLS